MEPDASLALKREDRKKIGPIESDMQLTVGRNLGRVHIGNINRWVYVPLETQYSVPRGP
jgi:hypothetical protein